MSRKQPGKYTRPPDEIDHDKGSARDTVHGDSLKEFPSISFNILQGPSVDHSVVILAVGGHRARCAALHLFDTSLMNILSSFIASRCPSPGFGFMISLARLLECVVGIQSSINLAL